MTNKLLLGATAFLLTGCLYTSHHFNSGRILAPGQTAVTVGYGQFKLFEAACPDENESFPDVDSTGLPICVRWGRERIDTVPGEVRTTTLPKTSLGYRLGVRGAWGPFTGVEMGWHLEAPTNPASAEFDLKLGLPVPEPWKAHHSISGGWIIGAWADNSFFGEYAASRTFGRMTGPDAHALYASYRLTYLATQPDETVGTGILAATFTHRRRTAHQGTLGVYLRIPEMPILPDYVSPHVTASTPWVRVLGGARPDEDLMVDVNMGFGWRF